MTGSSPASIANIVRRARCCPRTANVLIADGVQYATQSTRGGNREQPIGVGRPTFHGDTRAVILLGPNLTSCWWVADRDKIRWTPTSSPTDASQARMPQKSRATSVPIQSLSESRLQSLLTLTPIDPATDPEQQRPPVMFQSRTLCITRYFPMYKYTPSKLHRRAELEVSVLSGVLTSCIDEPRERADWKPAKLCMARRLKNEPLPPGIQSPPAIVLTPSSMYAKTSVLITVYTAISKEVARRLGPAAVARNKNKDRHKISGGITSSQGACELPRLCRSEA